MSSCIEVSNGKIFFKIGEIALRDIKFCLNVDRTWYTYQNTKCKGAKEVNCGDYTEVVIPYECSKGVFEGIIRFFSEDSAYIYLRHDIDFSEELYAAICIGDVESLETVLFYHIGRLGKEYSTAPRYYKDVSLGMKPKEPPPPDYYPYPPLPEEICFNKEEDQSCWVKPYWINDWRKINHNTPVLFTLFKCGASNLAIFPISAGDYRSVVRFGTEPFEDPHIKIWVRAYAKSSDKVLPGAIIVADKNPILATEKTFALVKRILGNRVKLSKEKRYPEIFEYLGWCTWNAFYRDIDEKKVVEGTRAIREKAPIGFVIVDDGWQDVDEDSRLKSFVPDSKKFPRGGKYLVEKIKEAGVRYVGFWITLQGYWRGLSEKLLEKYPNLILKGSNGNLIPHPENHKGFKVYRDLYSKLKEWEADFTKVDNQFDILGYVKGIIPVNRAAEAIQEMLQAAAYGQGLQILNCMCMVPEDYFHWLVSNVSRICMDYIPYWKDGAKKHIIYCVYNALWYSFFCWPDYDMFMSHDPYALPHAVSRAISGGPIYITDIPGKTDEKIVKLLCFSDGRILRPDTPALPAPEVLYKNPYEEKVALKAFTKAKVPGFGEVGIVAVMNVNGKGEKVDYTVSPKDVFETEGNYFIYEVFTEETFTRKLSDEIKGTLSELETRVYIISKIVDGVALAGVKGKIIAPKGVTSFKKRENMIIIDLYEPLELVIYSEKEPKEIFCDGKRCRNYRYTKDRVLFVKDKSKNIIIVL